VETDEGGIQEQAAALRSGVPEQVRRVLREKEPLDPRLAPHLIYLLAWDEVTRDAARALARIAPRVTGQLTDRLLDPEEEFTIRRRLPKVLAFCPTERSVEGLQTGLEDRRFEVRFQCGRALARIHGRHPEISLEEERVLSTVLREVDVDRKVWESERLLDKPADDEESLFVDEVLRERANRSLEHVFTLLSLILPKEPLRIAFRGLHTADRTLRGTALEYLETILPEEVRRSMWPFLEAGPVHTRDRRTREEVLDDLLRSNKSIQISLENLRQKRGKEREERE
jgi:hypothetical protein